MTYKFQNTKIALPSNKKFGYFIFLIFLISSSYFFLQKNLLLTLVFLTLAVVFLIIILVNSNILSPINKISMKLGEFLGIIISPIVLAFIYFGLFAPYGIVMRLYGRDELRLKQRKNQSYWRLRKKFNFKLNFKQQF